MAQKEAKKWKFPKNDWHNPCLYFHHTSEGNAAMRWKILLFSFLILATTSSAQLMTGRFITSFYGWQGRSATLEKQNYLRGFENVQFDFSQQHFSFNTNFQLSNDFGTSITTDPELRLSSLVVKARDIVNVADVYLGRQFVFAGVGNGLIDGVIAKTTLMERKIGITVYNGYNVVQSRTIDLNRSYADNALFGGQITVEPIENGIIGVSYMNRTRKPASFTTTRLDSLFHPYDVVIAYSPTEEEYASVDARYSFLNRVNLYGRSDYDFNLTRMSRAEISARVGLLSALTATAEYLFREPRVAYNSIFSVFTSKSTQEIEGGVEYDVMPLVQTFARFAYVQYKDDNSSRLTVGGSYDFMNISYTQNFGYAGDLNGVSVQAVYPVMERKLVPNFGFGLARFQLSDGDTKNTVLNASLGATYRPMPSLSTDVQLQWMRNPLYASDVRLFVKANYWFSERLSWF
jgi:hypothetical protein